MSKQFAQINNGIVQKVILADSLKWCQENLGGVWIEPPIGNDCGIGYNYNKKTGLCSPQRPKLKGVEISNLSLNAKSEWIPSVEDPKDGRYWSIFTNEYLAKEEIDVQVMKNK